MSEPVFDLDVAEQRLEALDETNGEHGVVNIRLFRLIISRLKRFAALEDRIATIVVVDTVADLPASAPPTRLFRVATGTAAERSSVYFGNGPGRPLGFAALTLL